MDEPREYVTYDDSTAAGEFERRTDTRDSIDCMGALSYNFHTSYGRCPKLAKYRPTITMVIVYMHDVAQAS